MCSVRVGLFFFFFSSRRRHTRFDCDWSSDVCSSDLSNKTNQINAYVTGVGASKRVVVWDNTIRKTTLNETLFIFGHEAGHYVLGHVRNGVMFFALAFFVAMYLCYRVVNFSLEKWGGAWKIYGPQDLACLAVLLLLFKIFSFISMPVESAFSRADRKSTRLNSSHSQISYAVFCL